MDDSAAAYWFGGVRGVMGQPGQSLGGFSFEGVGLVDIVAYRVQGHYDPPVYNDSLRWLFKARPSLWVNSVPGLTLGIAPFPADRSPANLLARLRGLADQSCGALNWITNEGVCTSLRAKLDAAAASLQRGDTQSARRQLESFLAELAAQHGPAPGKHVTDNGYWLLKVNAEYILTRL